MYDNDVSQCQKVKDLRDAALQSRWRAKREAMFELRDFMAGHRYEDDNDEYNRDRRLVQIRGQEIQDTIRHIAAKATEKPRSIEAHAMDEIEDPEESEVAIALLEAEFSNPWKGFDDCLEAAILDCRKRRLGVVMMDWVPDCGPFGEILDRWVDPTRVMWDPSFEDPHHPLCPWFLEEKRVDAKQAAKMYKKPWIKPDSEESQTKNHQSGRPVSQNRRDDDYRPMDDGKATLWFCWYKNDKTYKVKQKEGEPLPEDERYMACKTGCGYRSETQGEAVAAGEEPYPELMPEMCPTCGGDMERIDALDQDVTMLAYQDGKRLVIVAPYSQGESPDEAVYDGAWPVPARSFPVFVITAYQEPGDPCGPCDVDLMWDQQVGSDQLRTLAIQRVFEHRNYWEMPQDGIYDWAKKRFEFRDDQFNIMFKDYSNSFGGEVKLHQGTGLDPNWSIAFQACQDALTRYRPALDVGVSEENTRNIPVGTIERITHEAEVSTEHFIRRKNRALSKYYGVRWDYIRATYTPARLQRLNIDGVDLFSSLRGDDFPNFDFVLSEAPQFTGIEKQRAEAFQALMGVVQNPLTAPFLEVFAEINNLPKSVVKKVQKQMEQQENDAAQAAAEAEAMGATPMGAGGEMGGPPAPSDMDQLMALEEASLTGEPTDVG